MHKCDGCPHRDHSGAFTPGGALLTCIHPRAKGLPDLPGDTETSMFLRAGMSPENIQKLFRGRDRDEVGKLPDQHHWIRRVRPQGEAPEWCPEAPLPVVQERNRALAERVRILREALAMIDRHPTGPNSEPDSMAEALEQIHALAAAALEATKEGA